VEVGLMKLFYGARRSWIDGKNHSVHVSRTWIDETTR